MTLKSDGPSPTVTTGEGENGDHELRELMTEYQLGNPSAFEELYSRLLPQLRRYLSFLSSNRSLVDDLLQECFLQIHRVRHTYLPSRPFRPWAFGIARNVFHMDLRGRRRRRRRELEFPAVEWRPPAEIERLACRDTINHVLSGLPSARKEALLLHHALDLSFSEIGSLLGIRATTAKVRAHRGMVQLRKSLERERRKS
jgi:RNA polymerase sigma-70 factor (ECF subfamily)